MSAHVLLNLLKKREKCQACRAFHLDFATSLVNSIRQGHEFYLSYDIKIIFKLYLWREGFCHMRGVKSVVS